MIVFFGDHQPPLGNAFYEELYSKKLDDRTTEEVMHQDSVEERFAAFGWNVLSVDGNPGVDLLY